MHRDREAILNCVDIELACRRLISAFAYHVDHRHPEDAARLFAEDASFERKGEVLHGREAILQAQRDRPAGLVTRHVCAEPHIEVLDAGNARAVTYFQIYRGVAEPGATGVLPLHGPEVVGQFEDSFRLTPEGWRIHSRRARAVFRQSA